MKLGPRLGPIVERATVMDADHRGARSFLLLQDGSLVTYDWSVEVSDTIELSQYQRFYRPLSLRVSEDTVEVWDAGHVLLSRFAVRPAVGLLSAKRLLPDSVEVRQGGWKPLDPLRQHGRLEWTTDGYILETRPDPASHTGPFVWATLLRFGQASVDTLTRVRAPSYALPGPAGWECCLHSMYLAPQPSWDVTSQGDVVLTSGSRAEFHVIGPDSRPTLRVDWPHTDLTLTRSDRLAYLDALMMRLRPDRRREAMAVNRQMLPEWTPLFWHRAPATTQVLVDDRDQVWVRRFASDGWPEGAAQEWDVFTGDGRLVGTVILPFARVFRIGNGVVLGLHEDSTLRSYLAIAEVPGES